MSSYDSEYFKIEKNSFLHELMRTTLCKVKSVH